jgi:hypothetical protein
LLAILGGCLTTLFFAEPIVLGLLRRGQIDAEHDDLGANLVLPSEPPQAPPESADFYDVGRRRVETMKSGTVVGLSAPDPFTHLIIKSRTRFASGDLARLPTSIVHDSTFFGALVAQVRLGPSEKGVPAQQLTRVAVGFGARVQDEDVVIANDQELIKKANLGFFARVLQSSHEERAKQISIVIWSQTLAVVDVPTFLLINGRHVPGHRRYALLVMPRTGQLMPLLWFRPADASGPLPPVTVRRLAPNTLEDCALNVDGAEFSVGLPKRAAFAQVELPAGSWGLTVPDGQRELFCKSQFIGETARELHRRVLSLAERGEGLGRE